MLYSNDTSVNSNHVVIGVNKSIVCNEIETENVTNVNFEHDCIMLNILYVNCCGFSKQTSLSRIWKFGWKAEHCMLRGSKKRRYGWNQTAWL